MLFVNTSNYIRVMQRIRFSVKHIAKKKKYPGGEIRAMNFKMRYCNHQIRFKHQFRKFSEWPLLFYWQTSDVNVSQCWMSDSYTMYHLLRLIDNRLNVNKFLAVKLHNTGLDYDNTNHEVIADGSVDIRPVWYCLDKRWHKYAIPDSVGAKSRRKYAKKHFNYVDIIKNTRDQPKIYSSDLFPIYHVADKLVTAFNIIYNVIKQEHKFKDDHRVDPSVISPLSNYEEQKTETNPNVDNPFL